LSIGILQRFYTSSSAIATTSHRHHQPSTPPAIDPQFDTVKFAFHDKTNVQR
jgi:hypothetical protein